MTHIKFKNLTPDQPTNTLKIESDVKKPTSDRSIYTRTARAMKVGDSVGGLNFTQRSSLTQSLTRMYGGKNTKCFSSHKDSVTQTYRVWRIK